LFDLRFARTFTFLENAFLSPHQSLFSLFQFHPLLCNSSSLVPRRSTRDQVGFTYINLRMGMVDSRVETRSSNKERERERERSDREISVEVRQFTGGSVALRFMHRRARFPGINPR